MDGSFSITAADAAKSSATNAQTKGSSFLLTVILKRYASVGHAMVSRLVKLKPFQSYRFPGLLKT